MYKFNEVINRRGTNSIKWMDENVIPMWVADMDFKSPDVIISRLIERVGHGIYGYTSVPDDYYNAVIDWSKNRHKLEIQREWIIPSSGVVPSIVAALDAIVGKKGNILIQPPVYNAFYNVLKEKGLNIVENPLSLNNGKYELDLNDFEKKIVDEKVDVFILCNPHNPVGRSWSKEDLENMGEICKANGVTILADEIHRDLILSSGSFVPFLSLETFNDITVSLTSPSKTFNLGGVQVSNLVIPEGSLRQKIEECLNLYEVSSPNLFGIEALVAGYTEGGQWLDTLLKYLEDNMNYAKDYLNTQLPTCPVVEMDSTYLMWMDCRVFELDSEALNNHLIKHGVRLNSGSIYGNSGDGFLRINLATPRQTLDEGLKKIVEGLKNL